MNILNIFNSLTDTNFPLSRSVISLLFYFPRTVTVYDLMMYHISTATLYLYYNFNVMSIFL